jgi:hypothetical protein
MQGKSPHFHHSHYPEVHYAHPVGHQEGDPQVYNPDDAYLDILGTMFRQTVLGLVLCKLWLGASLESELSQARARAGPVISMALSIHNFGNRAGSNFFLLKYLLF